jgi:hypothetical protein
VMTTMRRWTVDVIIDEHEDERMTRAEARLHTGEQARLIGHGTARRNPRDTEVAQIGDELATARALSDLAHQLLQATANDIEEMTHRPVHLRG